KGPRQHVEANMAANPPANNAVEPLVPNESLLPDIGELRLFGTVLATDVFGSVALLAETSVMLSLIARRSSSREGTPLRCEPSTRFPALLFQCSIALSQIGVELGFKLLELSDSHSNIG